MNINQSPCPNCAKLLSFPTVYSGGCFRITCAHCYTRYDLVWLEFDPLFLYQTLSLASSYSFFSRFVVFNRLSKYIKTVASQNQFFTPFQPDAIIFLLSQSRSVSFSKPKVIYLLDDRRTIQYPDRRQIIAMLVSSTVFDWFRSHPSSVRSCTSLPVSLAIFICPKS